MGTPMRYVWLASLVCSGVLLAGTQDPEANVNSRYTVEAVTIQGDGWSTNVAADHRSSTDEKLSPGLRKQIAAIVGAKFNPAVLDELASKLRSEFHARMVTHRLLRGATPEFVQVIFEIQLPPARFDVSVPKFLYQGKQGWSGAVEGTATVDHNGFTAGLVSDNDELAERYSGVVARYENTRLGTDHVRFRFEFEDFHEQWNGATRDALAAGDGAAAETSGMYRSRQNVEPVVTFVLAKPLTLSVGAAFQNFDGEGPAGRTEAANAFLAALAYHREVEGSEFQQLLDAGYSLREGARALNSDFAYGRHRWDFRYVLTHGKHILTDEVIGGLISGRAPLFERFFLGNSSTLRGWNKYDIDPLGGNRMVHNSVEYRYGVFQVFYDSGAIWDSGQPAAARHSLGMGLRQGSFFLAVAFPVKEGRADPVFMVGMNY